MSEEKKATVIVVTTETGREIRYTAAAFGVTSDGTLAVGSELADDSHAIDPVAAIAPGRWRGVHADGAIADDSTVKALGIAKKALDEITRVSNPNVAIKLALDALGEIFAETDL